jgi:hypothetical protein
VNILTASNYISAINEHFPIAGKTNNSKGFTDNFYSIKTSLDLLNSSISSLSTQTVLRYQDNDIGGYNFLNLRIKNPKVTIAPQGYGSLPVDYRQANYWPITLLDSGTSMISIINMPSTSSTGVLIVSITTSYYGTQVIFTSTEATIISLGPDDQPFKLKETYPYLFEFRNDYTGTVPCIYIKKISQDLIYPITETNLLSDKFYGSDATFTSTINISGLTYKINTVNNSVIVTDQSQYGVIGLTPNIIKTVITGTLVAPAGGLTNKVAVRDSTGIYSTGFVRFAGTTKGYEINSVTESLITLDQFYDIGYTNVNDPITIVNDRFSTPILATISDISATDLSGSISVGSSYNLKGTLYADENTLQITFRSPDSNPNTFQLNISTTFTNTASTDLATIGMVHQMLPAGSIIMWTKSQTLIPYGWILCDGSQAPNGIYTPDLRNRFVLGADSEMSGVPTIIDQNKQQKTNGGSAEGVLLPHTHTATGTTFAVHDPGHSHLAVGPTTTSPFPDPQQNIKGPYQPSPQVPIYWGFTTTNTSTAAQWLTSLEYTFADMNGHSPKSGSGITLQTTISVDHTGTNSPYSNLPEYRSLYFIYKWLGPTYTNGF